MARWLLGSILLAFVAGGVYGGDDTSAGLEITYIANEGVLIASGEVMPAWEEKISQQVGAIEIEVLRLRHTREHHRWIQNLGHIVTLGGKKLLHLGDAEMGGDTFEAYDLAEENIDIAFIPYWYLLSGEGRRLVRNHIKPKQIIAVHLPPTGADDALEQIQSHFPEAVTFTRLLASKTYGD